LSLSTKIIATLSLLALAVSAYAAPIGDVRVPLVVKSKFTVRANEGPPANRNGLSRYASCYLFKFTKLKYKREVSFTSSGDFVYIKDYYGDYQLSNFQAFSRGSFVESNSHRAMNDSWKSDMKTGFGKPGPDSNKGPVELELPALPGAMQGIFGKEKSKISVTGSRSISFSGRSEWEDNLVNTGTFKQSKFPTLQMEQKSRFKVTGTIGSKVSVEVDQDSQRDVDLANTIKLRYKGDEDEILQSIEAGNTNLSLPNAQFIGYSQSVQGLFGIKATAKIGNLDLTAITSQEKGSSEKTTFNAGAKGNEKKIKDYEYLANTYFWLGVYHTSDDSLISVDLYTDGQPTDPNGLVVVTPLDSLPNITPDEDTRGEWIRRTMAPIPPDQYSVYKLGWYIVLNRQLTTSVLGAYIKYAHYHDGLVDTMVIGNLNYRPGNNGTDTTYVLKMLKYGTNTGFATWELMWKNVYDLGAKNISKDGFDLKIYKGTDDNPLTDLEDLNGVCYITMLGLDSLNNNTQAIGPDCIFDFNTKYIDAPKGHLIFPENKPFLNHNLGADTVGTIYTLARESNQHNTDRIYYIWVKTAERASSFSLGRANIMPNSEVVKLGDGTILKRDVDYSINYDIGQITFLSDQAMNPAANVSVDFEYAPFFMPEKKSLFGVAGQYKLWENSNISLAGMYRSEGASDPRPRVGREPRRGFIWDSNFSFSFKPELMTNMIDALPFVESEAPSSIDITGEIAQSFPNPNTKNEAYLDDFEGTRNYSDMGMRRGIWTKSSAPLDTARAQLPQARRGSMWWYNPFTSLRITDIWPERSVKDQDNRTDVLFLRYFPDSTSTTPESSWAGIMRPFYSGLSDQSLTKFIELWYYPDTVDISQDPILHLDFGVISEDIDNDLELDSEDRQTAGTAIGTFEPQLEDTGLDGLFDAQEPGHDTLTDPSLDDWSYDQNRSDDYSHINGTEGSMEDPDRRGRFDTEDINNNSGLDRQNGYFEYQVHMNNPEYLADSTSSGWKLLRIPLQDSTIFRKYGDEAQALFTNINFARVWFSGARKPYQMVLASFELVGNKWQEKGIFSATNDTTDYLRPDEEFEVNVKNTQENTNYYPPPGVEGNLDRSTGIREKEQSLVISYNNLAPNHICLANWSLYSSEDYTQYQNLKMYVHGDQTVESGVYDRQVMFVLRFGQNANNYYEYHTVLDTGWTESNWVNIDFTKMTALKYALQSVTPSDSIGLADTTDGNYTIHGNPSLSLVKEFYVGVQVLDGAPLQYTGEVWIDEMRVNNVRRKSDFASRIQVSARFSDLFDVGMSYSRTGADFYPLSAKAPAGSTNIAKSVRLNFRTDKLFPPSLGMSLPVSVSWQSSLALPRLKPGSDIILQNQARDLERTENTSYSYTVNESFNRNTKNWLWNLTLNRIKSGYTFSRSDGLSPATPINRTDSYKGNGSYDLSPKAKPGFKPFYLGKYLFLPKALYNSQLFPLPTQMGFSGEVNGRNSLSENQRGIRTSSRTKDLSLNGSTTFNIFTTLRTSYNVASARDISKPGRFKLSINPRKLKLGEEQTFQQRFESAFQPKLIQLIDTRFSFNSSYSENSNRSQNTDSTITTQMTGAFKTEATFNIQNLFKARPQGAKPPPPKKNNDKPKELKDNPDENGDDKEADDKDKEDDKKEEKPHRVGPAIGSPSWVYAKFGGMMRSIKPLRGSYLKDKRLGVQGLLDRPRWEYMFGLSEHHNSRVKSTTSLGSLNQSVFTDTYDMDTGLQPGHGLDITTGYTLRKSTTRSSTAPIAATSTTFPDVSVTLSGLEKLFIFKKFSSTVGLQSSYSKKTDESGQADTGEKYKRDTSKQWSPLAALNITLKNTVKVTLRYDLSRTISQNLKLVGQTNRDTYGFENTLKLSLSYSFAAPKGMKLPLLKRVKFNSQLSMNLDITVKNTRSESISEGVKSIDAQKSNLIVEPRMNYQFSRSISGGIRARWDDSNDKIQNRKHHIRELGLTAEIRF
jgi:cell surface protein SprA